MDVEKVNGPVVVVGKIMNKKQPVEKTLIARVNGFNMSVSFWSKCSGSEKEKCVTTLMIMYLALASMQVFWGCRREKKQNNKGISF